jgi:acyl dehydratase
VDRKTYDALTRRLYEMVAEEAHAQDALENDPTPDHREEAKARTRVIAGFLCGARLVSPDDSMAITLAELEARSAYYRDRTLDFGLSYGLDEGDLD